MQTAISVRYRLLFITHKFTVILMIKTRPLKACCPIGGTYFLGSDSLGAHSTSTSTSASISSSTHVHELIDFYPSACQPTSLVQTAYSPCASPSRSCHTPHRSSSWRLLPLKPKKMDECQTDINFLLDDRHKHQTCAIQFNLNQFKLN